MKPETRNPKSERKPLRAGSVSDGLRSSGRWLIFLLLLGHLIFCHGCHGEDVDDELSVPPPAARNSERPNEPEA
jgi:hypothetical protein